MRSPIPPEGVYESWAAHELRRFTTGQYNEEEIRVWLIRRELPKRAGWPMTWYRCTLEPLRALELLVGEGWQGWTEWSQPEGTYFRVAQNIIAGDSIIPAESVNRVKELAMAFSLERSPLFQDDPLILRGSVLEGPFTVIEGHHRASAVSVAVIQKRSLKPFLAFAAIVP